MSNIDLGDSPQGTPPDENQKAVIRTNLGITGGYFVQEIDYTIGDSWRINKPKIDPMLYNNPSSPNSGIFYNFNEPITITNADPSLPVKTLMYAGEYDYHRSYTIDGQQINVDPFAEPNFEVLFYDIVNNQWILRLFYEGAGEGGSDLSVYYVFEPSIEDLTTLVLVPSLWRDLSENYDVISSTEFPSTSYLPATANLEIFEPQDDYGNLFISSIDPNTGITEWIELVKKNGNVGTPQINLAEATGFNFSNTSNTGVLSYSRGGTNSTSQQDAVGNLSAWVVSISQSHTVVTSNRGATLSVSSVNDLTVTIPTGLTDHFTFKVLRRGTGEVSIVAGAGVTLLSANSHTRISQQYDMVTVTRLSQNTFVLSGNLKA